MESALIYTSPHAKITYEAEIQALHLEWSGFTPSREFRQVIEISLSELKERDLYKMIADNRSAKAVDPGDQKWLTEDWFPRAIAAGFRYSAVIVSGSALNLYASDTISHDVISNLFRAQNFTNLEEAREWLSSL
ncbi:MAG: hypothetical protein ABIJ57_05720 [Pseudomonadota bacterium]